MVRTRSIFIFFHVQNKTVFRREIHWRFDRLAFGVGPVSTKVIAFDHIEVGAVIRSTRVPVQGHPDRAAIAIGHHVVTLFGNLFWLLEVPRNAVFA